MTKKMQLCRIIYYSLAALHVSSDIFVHHQEHLNCITASGITHVMSLPAGIVGVLELCSNTRRNCCSPVTTYLQDSENDNYYTKFNIDYDVASLLHTIR